MVQKPLCVSVDHPTRPSDTRASSVSPAFSISALGGFSKFIFGSAARLVSEIAGKINWLNVRSRELCEQQLQ
jgi:hypothetical protein